MALFASMPNHRTFFALFEEGGANAQAAAGMLDDLMRSWPENPDLRREIKLLEEEGDRITQDLIHELYTTTVTPCDREDIHALAAALDDVVDTQRKPQTRSASTRSRRRWSRPSSSQACCATLPESFREPSRSSAP